MSRQLLNTITLFLVIAINYLAGTGTVFNKTIGEVSTKYDSLIVPAKYTFSIWILIYIQLFGFTMYQWKLWKVRNDAPSIIQIDFWFTMANLANISWIITWLNESIGFSVLIMLLLLTSLVQLVRNLHMELWDAPFKTIFFIWWPICIYLGWIILATAANIFAFLISIDWWEDDPTIQISWTIIMIVLCTLVYGLLIYFRNMRETGFVGAWGFIGISFRHWHQYPQIALTAIIGAVLLLIYSSYHAYKNRATSPFKKLKEQK